MIKQSCTLHLKLLKNSLNVKKVVYDGLHIYTEKPLDEIADIKCILPQNVIIEGWWQQNGNFFSAMEMEKESTLSCTTSYHSCSIT